MRNATTSSLSASIAESFAHPITSFEPDADILSPSAARLADSLAWLNDDADNFLEDWTPGWQDDDAAFEPSEEDMAFYRSIDPDQGYPAGVLTPAEQDDILGTISDLEWRAEMAEHAARVEAGHSWL